MSKATLSMDIVCELASELTDYIWNIEHPWSLHSEENDNGDLVYKEEAQDIFCKVLDIIDRTVNEL